MTTLISVYARTYEYASHDIPSDQQNHYNKDRSVTSKPAFRSSFGGESFHNGRSSVAVNSRQDGTARTRRNGVRDGHAYGAHRGEYLTIAEYNTRPFQKYPSTTKERFFIIYRD